MKYFQLQVFIIDSVSSGPLSIFLGPFRIFTKVCGDIRNFVFIASVDVTDDINLPIQTIIQQKI